MTPVLVLASERPSRHTRFSVHSLCLAQVLRAKFEARHVDQVWEDVRKPTAEVHEPGKAGPRGTTAQ